MYSNYSIHFFEICWFLLNPLKGRPCRRHALRGLSRTFLNPLYLLYTSMTFMTITIRKKKI